ncbi:MAG: peptidase M64 [Bacteroidales bacterium]|nr:peptidase M64 [Bacteroidales bacterium]
MKKFLLLPAVVLLSAIMSVAADYTLRLDYIFSGDATHTEISLAKMSRLEGWWGRTVNMDNLLLRGNGQIILRDSATSQVLYCTSFSTLFSEWQCTPEALHTRKAFENVYLVPMPQATAYVTVNILDKRDSITASMTHIVHPDDILIRPAASPYTLDKCRYVHKGGDSKEAIDIAIVGEGYTKEEMDIFYRDAKETADQILSYEPFKGKADKLNFIAVPVESKESGVSIPLKGEWKQTAFSSHFSTFYSDRYLTTLHLFDLHDALSSVPYEHIIILANTDNYGGGGILNSYVLTAAHNRWAMPVVVHEFGHSFAGLADEYFYDDGTDQYDLHTEPWEPNITTLVNFDSKWKDLVEKSGIVTKADQRLPAYRTLVESDYKVGIYEGGGYLSEGIYRPYPTCRMKDNTYPLFCPVCQRAISRMIDYQTVSISK